MQPDYKGKLLSTVTSEQVMALAAIFQFASHVESLAKTGQIQNQDIELAVNSLLCKNPTEPLDVYGKISFLTSGLEKLTQVFQRKPTGDQDGVRYVMGILHLQKQLLKRNEMLDVIDKRLDKVSEQIELFSTTHENVIASLADTYTDTISRLSFRIQVVGEYNFLQQTRIANQIRTLLFAAIRSGILWNQLGGTRLRMIWERKSLIQKAQQLQQIAKHELLH